MYFWWAPERNIYAPPYKCIPTVSVTFCNLSWSQRIWRGRGKTLTMAGRRRTKDATLNHLTLSGETPFMRLHEIKYQRNNGARKFHSGANLLPDWPVGTSLLFGRRIINVLQSQILAHFHRRLTYRQCSRSPALQKNPSKSRRRAKTHWKSVVNPKNPAQFASWDSEAAAYLSAFAMARA